MTDPATVAPADPADPLPHPWRPGLATGVGSLPGTDPAEAARFVAGELADLPHLVELPGRGAGADMIGRTLAVCVDLPGEVVPSGWRLTRRPGRDAARAADYLAWDLDAAEEAYAGAGWVKLQAAGPWTLAAEVETPRGHRAVTDDGAVRDLAASLAEGLAEHLRQLGRRLPGTRFAVQIDEPCLPEVLAGALPTASGFGRLAPVDPQRIVDVLAALVAALDDRPTIAHCCHSGVPLTLLRSAGFGALSFDMAAFAASAPTEQRDALGEAVEGGITVLAGLVPTAPSGGDTADPTAPGKDSAAMIAPLQRVYSELGLPVAALAGVVVTPTCGLGASTAAWSRRALPLAREAARRLADLALG